MPLTNEALLELDRASYLNLATFRRSGVAVETPVWFAAQDGRLYVFTEARAGKVKRLRNDDRIRVAPCGVAGRLRGPWTPGTARRIEDPAQIESAYAALRRKYGAQMWITDTLSKLSGRYEQRAMLELSV